MISRLIALVILALLLWAGIPTARTAFLIEEHGGSAVTASHSLPLRDVSFSATDGVPLRGWLVPARHLAPTIILIPGFKADRMTMLPYARLLHPRYTVLLYDPRGTGQSGGVFCLGAGEVRDVRGALRFVERSPGLARRPIGLLGVSLGSGDAIVAAAQDHHVAAVVADSPYTDQTAVVHALDRLHAGPVTVPLAPLAPFLVDHLCHVTIAHFRPIAAVGHIAPRALLLIHARGDTNSTTLLSAAEALLHAAHAPAFLWIAPHGGHAAALAAQPNQYRAHVLTFFRRYLR
ncbi:MAG TPA: alpha/beta fold hydrolase [Chloroflexota bacterium]|nr:alpha/beta fold hydrolase [Chloroflexota bacterium]